jgi:ectoine hydroxylase-related dioxygenase (phytanoyl-CoA dioxygenase family)
MSEQLNERYIISDAQREEYNNNGAVALRGVISDQWQRKLADSIEKDIANPGPFFHGYENKEGEGKFHGNLRIWQNDPGFKDYCLKSCLPDIAQQFFQSNRINLLYDQLFVKEPGTDSLTPWHNDQPFWPVRGRQVISFWTSLDPVSQESGALNFIRGSNNWDRWFQPEAFGDGENVASYEQNENYEPMPDIDNNLADYDIITWDLEPGDVYVFQGLTVHGSGGNSRRDRRRRGYTVRYTGDDVSYDTRPGTAKAIHDDNLKDGDALKEPVFPIIFNNIK